jgi:hypothetical protein
MKSMEVGQYTSNMARVDYIRWKNGADEAEPSVELVFSNHVLVLDGDEYEQFYKGFERWEMDNLEDHVMVHFPHPEEDPNVLRAKVKVEGVVGTYET